MASSGTMVPWTAHAPDLDHRAQNIGNFNMNASPMSQPTGPPRPTTTIVQVCADAKPRLTKDQHEILERHFQAQPKPSTSVKKGFADALGVPLDKINNWFQNRRAKVKQDAKKQMNAIQLFQATLAQHSQQYLAHPPQVAAQLPYHYGPLPVVPSNTETVSETSAPQQPVMAPATAGVDKDNMPVSQDGSFVPATAFPMQAPVMTSAPQSMPFEAQAFPPEMAGQPMMLQDFDFGPSFSQDFMAMPENYDGFMQQPGTLPPPMDAMSAHAARPTPEMSASPMSMPALTSAYIHPSQPEDDKPQFIEDSPQEYADYSATTGHPTPAESTTTWSSVAPGQDFFDQQNASAPVLAVCEGSPVSIDSLERHDSFALSDSMSNACMDQLLSDSETSFKAPSELSGLAARRQKPRPANLMSTALRSASYTAGMPGSPGANATANSQDHLRRIRSHGVGMNNGRITKSSGPQKSPMNPNFDAAALASPKFARHASNFSVSTINSSGPLTATTMPNSLAPPTPITPNEFTRFPIGQVQAFGFPNGSPGAFSHTGEDVGFVNMSSPMAKLDMQQMEQYRASLMARHDASLFHTPPQSAPASQQHFGPQNFGLTPPSIPNHMINGHGALGHLRRPSLPDGSNPEMIGQPQASMPMSSAHGMQPPMDPHTMQAYNADPYAFMSSNGAPADRAVNLHYMMPQASRMLEVRKPVQFYNQTPEDFANTTQLE